MLRALVLQKNLLSSLCLVLPDHKFTHIFQDTLNPLCIPGNTLKQHLITLSTIIISPIKEAPF